LETKKAQPRPKTPKELEQERARATFDSTNQAEEAAPEKPGSRGTKTAQVPKKRRKKTKNLPALAGVVV
jgi:hypothetical protein